MNALTDLKALASAGVVLENNDDSGSLSFNGVTGVTGVTSSIHAGSQGVTPVTPDGDGVTNPPNNSDIPNESQQPCFRVLEKPFKIGEKTYPSGVWYFEKEGKLTRICSPLFITATTCDSNQDNFGRLLRFKNSLGKWRTWAMPMALLSSSGDELRSTLLGMGLEIAFAAKDRMLFMAYLQGTTPRNRVQCMPRVGWADRGAFVLPDSVIGPKANGYIYQGASTGDEFITGGTLSGWQAGISDKAVGNPLLMVALSAAFSGPLLERLGAESGGLHFIGDSSTGKTTLVEAACSVYGGANYKRSWRATSNGMEGAAATFNDALLALDEISECDPREVGSIVYALGNGKGKQRANRNGGARTITQWRTSVVSSGERSVSTAMLEGGKQAKAGQAVRLLDIPASRTFGAWDDLHGMPDGAAFSDAIKRASASHYGHAGRSFIAKLANDTRDLSTLLNVIKEQTEFASSGGQDKRAVGRLAVIALAGELAIEYRLVKWEQGRPLAAAILAFETWQAMRGTGNDEPRKILLAISDFIAKHGDSRFNSVEADSATPVYNRAGWWRDTSKGREFLFTSAGIREALVGFDLNRALDSLQASGALPPTGDSGKRSQLVRVAGQPQRLYVVSVPSQEL
jgi:putative DNA primase/helicase